MTAIDMRNDDWHLAAEAIESEIEHTRDLMKDIFNTDELRTEQKREARLVAIREYILSATYDVAVR